MVSGFLHNKTDRHDVIEILLKMAFKHRKPKTKRLPLQSMPLSTPFQLYRGRQFYWWRKPVGVPREYHQPATSHWRTLSHKVVWSTPRPSGIRTHNCDWHWLNCNSVDRSITEYNCKFFQSHILNNLKLHFEQKV